MQNGIGNDIHQNLKYLVIGTLSGSAIGQKIINSRFVMQNVSNMTQIAVAVKQAMRAKFAMFVASLFVVSSHVMTTDLKLNCFLLDQETRTIGFMEPNTFYRLVIQAYGAQERCEK